jgi:hypothetical protein
MSVFWNSEKRQLRSDPFQRSMLLNCAGKMSGATAPHVG